jgi:hypothetical protein
MLTPHAPTRTSRSRRTLRGLGLLALLAPVLSAPTPGNVGGCGGTLASTPIEPHVGNNGANLESTYFERGLCAGFCQRLYDCNLLCDALQNPPANCQSDPTAQASAFYQCVNGTSGVLRSELFSGGRTDITVTACPKTCPSGTVFAISSGGNPLVYQWDVQVCADAALARSCSTDVTDQGSVLTTFVAAPSECANPNVCRTP